MIQGLRPRPIMAGLVVDLAGSVILSVGYAVVRMALDVAAGRADSDQIVFTTADYVVSAVMGLLLVVAGGYVAGRMARVRPVAHGLCVGIAVLVITVIINVLAPDPQAPAWFNVASTIGAIIAATIGGGLAAKPT
jgi:putative membrane protein (TIGR04086 family)